MARAVAFLGGTVFTAVVTHHFPNTPWGRALGAAVLWVALHPFAQLTWLKPDYEWRYWIGGASAVPLIAMLELVGRGVPNIVKETLTVVIIAISIVMLIVTRKRHRAGKGNA